MLADIQVERREISLTGGSFHVEGLSLESFATLVRTHLKDLEAVFDLFSNLESLQDANLEGLAIAALEEAPGFCANVIALAAGEPQQAPKVAKFPFPVLVEALVTVAELTFADVGGVKKFLPTVAKLLGVTDMKEAVGMIQKVR